MQLLNNQNPNWYSLTGFMSFELIDLFSMIESFFSMKCKRGFSEKQIVFIAIHYLKNKPTISDGCALFSIRNSATYRKHLVDGIQILSELFDKTVFDTDKKLPKLEYILKGRKFDPPNLKFCRFVIDGRHQRSKIPSAWFSYYPVEFFSFKFNKEAFNTLYIIDLNGFIRFISPAYPAARNDSYIYTNERQKILNFLRNLLNFYGFNEDPIVMLADKGFPSSNTEEIIQKPNNPKNENYKLIQSSRNKVEQVFGRQSNILPSTRVRFEFSFKYFDAFQKAAAFLVNFHINKHPISIKFHELFEKLDNIYLDENETL